MFPLGNTTMPTIRTVLFDETCKLCTSWIRFLKKRDGGTFHFIAVQSFEGQRLLALHGYPTDRFDTLVYLDGERIYDKSTAIMAILGSLGGIWRTMIIFSLIPAQLRDYAYLKLARNRYRIMGRVADCHCDNEQSREPI